MNDLPNTGQSIPIQQYYQVRNFGSPMETSETLMTNNELNSIIILHQ